MRVGDRVEIRVGTFIGEEGLIGEIEPGDHHSHAVDLDGYGRIWARESDLRLVVPRGPLEADATCEVPPPGWWCSRASGHDGPCAARQTAAEEFGEGGRNHLPAALASQLLESAAAAIVDSVSDVQREVLVMQIEELAEATQCATKILRFGMRKNPYKPQEHNRDRLETELGDVLAIMTVLDVLGVISLDRVLDAHTAKCVALLVPTGRISEELRAILARAAP